MRYHALAADFDGTLAHHGRIAAETWKALRELKASGRKLVMVTGRQLDELLALLEEAELFDRIVAENGALVYDPATKQIRALAPAPPAAFTQELRHRGVERVVVGRVIVATWEPHQDTVLSVIHDQGLELQVIFNKGAVMILPPGINKATGLRAALVEIELSVHDVVAVGDAENDHAMLAACECGVAVANALPSVRAAADLVTDGDHGIGVGQLVQRLLDDDLAGVTVRHRVLFAKRGDSELLFDPCDSATLVCGTSGSGKSTFTTGLLERLHAAAYQFAVIDPEGDYNGAELALALGDPQRAAVVDEVLGVLADTQRSVAVNLLGVALDHRPEHASKLLAAFAELRARTGRPHVVVIDEAHHMLPAKWEPAADVPLPTAGMVYVTVHADSVAPVVLETVDRIVVLGEHPDQTLAKFAAARGIAAPAMAPIERLAPGRALLWQPPAPPIEIEIERPIVERQRHSRKYAEGNLGQDRAFVFRGPNGELKLAATNLMLFLLLGDGVDDGTWTYHLERADYSRWIRTELKDDDLADAIASVETAALTPAESRGEVRRAIEARYTLPADKPSGIVDGPSPPRA
jgi:HAD superfamily hydrolase (TIGR01484 family)